MRESGTCRVGLFTAVYGDVVRVSLGAVGEGVDGVLGRCFGVGGEGLGGRVRVGGLSVGVLGVEGKGGRGVV